MQRSRIGIALIGLALLIFIGIQVRSQLIAGGVIKPYHKPTPEELAARAVLERLDRDGQTGSEKAPVKVLVFVPLRIESWRALATAIIDDAERRPDAIRLVVLDKNNTDSKNMKRAVDLGAIPDRDTPTIPSTVLVNRKSEFVLSDASGKKRTVSFRAEVTAPEPAFTAADVIQAIEQALAERK